MSSPLATSAPSARWIFCLGVLYTLTPFTIDLYLPAFEVIARDLNTEVQRLSLSVSIYFVGYALGQIFYGPLLDRFGRKKPIYFGLGLYFLATLGCMRAQSIEALLFFRFVSALGGSAASVGAMTFVRDLFPPPKTARVFSMLMLVLSTSPLFAPSIGSFFILHWDWRSLFALLGAFCLIDMAIVAWALPNHYAPNPQVSLHLAPILKNFREIFRHPQFRVHTLAGSLSFAGLFVYVAGSPGIFIDYFRVNPQTFGLIFALLAVGLIGGGQLSNFLNRRYSAELVFRRAIYIQLVFGLVFLIYSLTAQPALNVTFCLLFAILSCAGISYPNAAAIALEPFAKNAGSAASLLGFLQLGLGAAVAALLGVVAVKGPLPTAVAIALSSSLACAVLLLNPPRTATMKV